MEAGPTVARQFGRNLHRERKRAGLSQEEVGFRASLHRTEIGLLERGARTPRIDTLVKLAAALGVRIDCALLEGITWNTGSTQLGTSGSRRPTRGRDIGAQSTNQRMRQPTTNETAKPVVRSTPRATGPKTQPRASEIEPELPLGRPQPTTAPQHDTLRTLRSDAWAAPSGSGRSPSAEATVFPGVRRPIVARLRRATAACKDARETEGQDRCELLIWPRPMQTAISMDNRCVKRNTSTTFFTERSLAAYLAVSDRTIRNWIRRGELPTYKLGAARRIDPADVEDFLTRHKDEAA